MLPWVCSVIDHRGRQNVVKTSETHSACGSCATSLFLPHFDVICDLLLNRCTNDVTCYAVPVVLFLVFRKNNFTPQHGQGRNKF